jgi:hypothetical protein
MFNNVKIIFYLLLASFALSSCQTYYVPQHVVSPMHEKKGDLELNVQGLYSASGSANYAFSNHFMAGLSTNVYSQKDTLSNNNFTMKGATIDLGYYTIDKESNKRFEVMAGFGGGNILTQKDEYDFARVYLQPSIGFVKQKIESIVSLRINGMFYEPTPTNASNISAFSVKFIEPAYTFRGGGTQLKFQGQFGFSLPISSNLPNDFAFVPFMASVGLSYKLYVLKDKFNPVISN